MFGLPVSECLLYGGIITMAVTVFAAIICTVIFRVTGKKIREALKQEYGI